MKKLGIIFLMLYLSFSSNLLMGQDCTAVAQDDFTVCEKFATVTANEPKTGEKGWWSSNPGSMLVFDDSTSNVTTVRNLRIGANVLYWNIQKDNCLSYDDVIIVNYSFQAIAGNDKIVCEDEIILSGVECNPDNGQTFWTVLEGDAEFHGTFNPDGLDNEKCECNLDTSYCSTVLVRNLKLGENKFLYTLKNKYCTSTDTLSVINEKIYASAGKDMEICETEVYLNADTLEGVNGYWSCWDEWVNIENSTSHSTKVTDLHRLGSTQFTWTTSNDYCTGKSSVLITNNQAPVSVGHMNRKTVRSNSTYLDGIYEHGSCEWSVYEGQGVFEDASNPKTKVTDLGRGINVFLLTLNHKKCISTDTVTIIWEDITIVNAGEDQVVCENFTKLDAWEPSPEEGQWCIISGKAMISDLSSNNTEITNIRPGENIFRWNVIMNGYEVHDYVSIFYLPVDSVDDKYVCDNSIVLKAKDFNESFFWEHERKDGIINYPYADSVKITHLQEGENIIRFKSYLEDSCTDEFSVFYERVDKPYDFNVELNNDTVNVYWGLDWFKDNDAYAVKLFRKTSKESDFELIGSFSSSEFSFSESAVPFKGIDVSYKILLYTDHCSEESDVVTVHVPALNVISGSILGNRDGNFPELESIKLRLYQEDLIQIDGKYYSDYKLYKEENIDRLGEFAIDSVEYGSYLLEAYFVNASQNFINTYYKLSCTKQDAEALHFSEEYGYCDQHVFFELQQMPDMQGNGQLKGTLYTNEKQEKRRNGETPPAVGVAVFLIDQASGLAVQMVYTDEEGNYEFNKIPNGEYKLAIDYKSIPMDDIELIVINEENKNHAGIDFIINDKTISKYTDQTSGVEDVLNLDAGLELYPNPSQGLVFLRYSSVDDNDFLVNLYNSSGVKIHVYEKLSCNSLHKLEFENPGLYLIEIIGKAKTLKRKIIIK